jgi:hypothetical protein
VCSLVRQEPDLSLIAIQTSKRLANIEDEDAEGKRFEMSVKSQKFERDLLATCKDLHSLAAGPCVCHLFDKSGGEKPPVPVLKSAPLLLKILIQAASRLQTLTNQLCNEPVSKFMTDDGNIGPLLGLLNACVTALVHFSELLSLQIALSRNEQSDKVVIHLIQTYQNLIDRHKPIFSKKKVLDQPQIDHVPFGMKARQVAPPLAATIVTHLIKPYVGVVQKHIDEDKMVSNDTAPLKKSLQDAIHAARMLLWASISAEPESEWVNELCLNLGPCISCVNSSLHLLVRAVDLCSRTLALPLCKITHVLLCFLCRYRCSLLVNNFARVHRR